MLIKKDLWCIICVSCCVINKIYSEKCHGNKNDWCVKERATESTYVGNYCHRRVITDICSLSENWWCIKGVVGANILKTKQDYTHLQWLNSMQVLFRVALSFKFTWTIEFSLSKCRAGLYNIYLNDWITHKWIALFITVLYFDDKISHKNTKYW